MFTKIPPTATKRITATAIPPTKRPTQTATPKPVLLYDFIRSAPDAYWEQRYSDDGVEESRQIEFFTTPYPYNKELYVGEYDVAFAGWQTSVVIEDGSRATRAVAVFPYSGFYSFGRVLGYYDLTFMTIQRGDVFRVRAGYEGKLSYEVFDPPADGVLFQIIFFETSLAEGILVEEWFEFDDGQTYSLDISLDSLAGKRGYMVLVVDSIGNTTGDFSLWIRAEIWGVLR
jgi:hypothetical protein